MVTYCERVASEARVVLDHVTVDDATVGMVHTLPILSYEVVTDVADVFVKSHNSVVFLWGVEVTDAKVAGLDILVTLKFVEEDEREADADVVLVSGTCHLVVILLWGWVNNDWDCVVAIVPVKFKLEVAVSLKNVGFDDAVVDEAFALDPDDIIVILALTIRVVG